MSYNYTNYAVYAWDLANVTSTGGTLFPDADNGKSSPAGATFTIDATAALTKITVSDNDKNFNDGDTSQDATAAVVLDGKSHPAGDIAPEYSYIVRPAGSNNPADNITVYAINMGNDVMGFVSTAPMQPGQTYTVLSLQSNCPSVPYSCLATTALPPLVTLDGIVEGTAGADLIDYNYTGDPDGDRIDHNDAILPGEAPQDDIVEAGAGNDTVYAGEGDDEVYGEAGDDLLYGEAGDDYLSGGEGNDTLDGGTGDDTLLGGSGDDNISGGAGADLVLGGAGADLISGGAGDDTLFGDNASCVLPTGDYFPEWQQAISNVVFYFDTDGDGVADYSAKVDGFPNSGSAKFISNDLDMYYTQMRDFLIASDSSLDPGSTVIGVSIKGGIQPTQYFQVDGNTNGTEPDSGSIMNTGPGVDYETFYNDFYTHFDPALVGSGGGAEGAGNDTISGGDGNDVIFGEGGDDSISGDAGDDRIYGGEGNDSLAGGSGNDVIWGDSGGACDAPGNLAEPLTLSAANVKYGSQTGADGCANAGDSVIYKNVTVTEDGRTVMAKLILVDRSSGLNVDLTGGAGKEILLNGNNDSSDAGKTASFRLEFYDQATGLPIDISSIATFGDLDKTAFAEKVGIPADQFTTYGLTADTSLTLNAGSMITAMGTEQNDPSDQDAWFSAAFENRSFINFTLTTREVNSGFTLNGAVIDQPVIVDLHPGNDTLDGGEGEDTLYGEGGNDLLTGGAGADHMYGGDDRDTFIVGSGADGAGDFIDGGEGGDDYDVLDLTGAGPLNVVYDPMNPENGTVSFLDGDGNVTGTLNFVNIEKVITDQGDGIVEGTAGDDLIDLAYLGDPEGDRIDHNDALLPGEAPQDDIVLAGDGNDTVYAGEGNDKVYGEAGNDLLYGEDGDDYLSGGEGDDTLYGGAGNDTLDAGQGSDVLYGEEGDDLLLGGPREDLLDGGAGNDTLLGGNAADTLIGGAGDDSLIGNQGNDSIIGGDGNDYADGGDGDDYINTSGGGAHPLPDLGYPGLFPADADPFNDRDTVFGGAGNDTIITGDDADWIDGGTGNDVIDAGFDRDTVFGGEGDDFIVGGEGSDYIEGGAGNDTIYGGLDPSFPDALNVPDAIDLVHDNGRDTIHGGDGNDVIFGQDDDDLIFGDAGDDYIDGGIDEDTIFGGTGNDTIIGGEGADSISGGDDRDTFIVNTGTAGLGDFIDGDEGGDDYDTLNLTGAGPLRVIYDPMNAENGIVEFLDGVGGPVKGTLTFKNIENVIPCFTPGTLVATPRGELPVEELRAGDRVITRDNGIQQIRWVGKRALNRAELAAAPHLRPVLIRAGSLGNGLPERDTLVSPNHRMLVTNDRTALFFEEHEVLVAAKHLVDNKGILPVEVLGTSYLHFMFDRHEVVLANGAWTESFQPGDQTLGGMGNAQRNEIFELFPELKTREGVENYSAARRTLKRHEAALLGR
jgi:Ca2+-binding RTX toxin-like protein